MNRRKLPNFHTRQLTRDLVQLRQLARLRQVDVARATEISDQKISRMETGQLPTFLELNAMLDLYGVPICDWKPFQDTWRLAKRKAWWDGLALRDKPYICNEHEASSIRDVQLTYLPVLLQTENYARHLLDTAEPPLSRERLPVELQARLRRQELLDGDHPVQLHALIYQQVLHAGVDRVQLKHLLHRAAQANVLIQIIPQPDVPHGGLDGSFTLLSFPHKDEPDIVYTSDPLGPTQYEKADHVATLRYTFASLLSRAMTPEKSRAYIESVINKRRP